MKLTEEQQQVVDLKEGKHLVLAPPGSGKTEMLSQRIMRALDAGVRPEKMFCATFTNRAAFEMRDRVSVVAGDRTLPEVGNIHHFCHRFLMSVGRLHVTKHVLDEVQQLEFIQEIVDVLRMELRSGASSDVKRSHGVSVIVTIPGMRSNASAAVEKPWEGWMPSRLQPRRNAVLPSVSKCFNGSMCQRLCETVETLFASYEDRGKNPLPDILTAVQITRQRKCGIPTCYLRQIPPGLHDLARDGVIGALEIAYRRLKRKFLAVDFDDLVNETYLYLTQHPVADERKFDWIQVDEVQDLNPLQWKVIRELTSSSAVSVYFGDVEQSIFSFLGASSLQLASAVSDCERHFFRTNFRATPLLLEVLMRYSIDVLHSDWEFLPSPSDVSRANGEVQLSPETSPSTIADCVRRLLENHIAENVAVLVRDNVSADACEHSLRPLGFRYVKVSGFDLFATAVLRDFMAFTAVVGGTPTRTDWTLLVRRFADGVFTHTQARYFVRDMFSSGFEPQSIFADGNPVPTLPLSFSRAVRWAWVHRRALLSVRACLKPIRDRLMRQVDGPLRFREIFTAFSEVAFGTRERYSKRELWPELRLDKSELESVSYARAHAHAVARMETFFRYTEFCYRTDNRTWLDLWKEDGSRLSKLKEADLLTGDEQIVISTIHKAKGRQFDAVVIPDVSAVVDISDGTDAEEPPRLLYVAMSRAKRHLFLFGCGESAMFGSIGNCFTPDYVGYYLRKARGEGLEDDWLSQWEMLALHLQRRECPIAVVTAALGTQSAPIRRMALKVLCHCSDRAAARIRFLECLSDSDVGDTAIACLSVGAFHAVSDVTAVRKAVVSENCNDRMRGAALAYYRGVISVPVAESAGTAEEIRRSVLAAASDLLYAHTGMLRHAAETFLAANGESRFSSAVTGAFADFERLADIPAPEHEATIRTLLETNLSRCHESALRKILLTRSRILWYNTGLSRERR